MRKLWEHQIQAFKYSLKVERPALFMEMRLGKNLVVIRRSKLLGDEDAKILVVCPVSAFDSWKSELASENESYHMLTGPRLKRLKILEDFLRASGRRWAIINKEGHLALPEIAQVNWTSVILDESHFIKNPKARVTKFFLKNFHAVRYKWILTGTPNPEGDLDMICQLLFLDGMVLKAHNYWDFRTRYCEPDWRGYEWTITPPAKNALLEHISQRCFIMRRRDAKMDREKIYIRRTVQLTPELRASYNKLEREFILTYKDFEKRTIWSISSYAWLRRLCGGFIDESLVWKGKLDELKYLLDTELKGESVVVWFAFNAEIAAARRMLINYSCASITGETPPAKRSQIISAFNSGEIKILLMQVAVAETGLNLSRADTAIYYSNPTGLMARKQSEDRILHLQKTGPLLYIDLITENTVDEDLAFSLKVKSLESDVSLSQAVYEEMKRRVEKNARCSQKTAVPGENHASGCGDSIGDVH